MPSRITEVDRRSTPWGEISLRRRHDPVLGREVFEVPFGGRYSMSGSFTTAEEDLASLAQVAGR